MVTVVYFHGNSSVVMATVVFSLQQKCYHGNSNVVNCHGKIIVTMVIVVFCKHDFDL